MNSDRQYESFVGITLNLIFIQFHSDISKTFHIEYTLKTLKESDYILEFIATNILLEFIGVSSSSIRSNQ